MAGFPTAAKRLRPLRLLGLSPVVASVLTQVAPGGTPNASGAATPGARQACDSWTPVVTPNAIRLEAVDEISPGDVWAVGQQSTEHWDGTAWRVVSSPNIGA